MQVSWAVFGQEVVVLFDHKLLLPSLDAAGSMVPHVGDRRLGNLLTEFNQVTGQHNSGATFSHATVDANGLQLIHILNCNKGPR